MKSITYRRINTMANKTEAQKLQEELTWSAPHIAKEAPEQKEQAYKYCEGYKEFLNTGKTERECVKEAVRMLKEAGYRLFDRSETYAPGDKVYFVNREKAVSINNQIYIIVTIRINISFYCCCTILLNSN